MTPEDTTQASPPEEAKPSPKSPEPNKSGGSPLERLKVLIKRHPMRAGAIGFAVLVAAIVGLTDLKYPVVGLFYKSTVELSVVDPEINEPISEASVQVNGASGLTDKDGKITLKGVSPGKQQVTITKKAYQTYSENKKIKFGQSDLGTVNLQINGVRVSFAVSNKISTKPLEGAKITIGEATAVTQADGSVTVSVETKGKTTATAAVSKDGFLTASVEVSLKKGQKPVPVAVVPSGKVYYLTNRSRKINLMRSNLDGSGEELVLAGTGNEDSQTGILPNIGKPHLLAVLTSRDGRRDASGYLKHDLFVLNGDTKKLTRVEYNVEFDNYRSWAGDNLVYQTYNYSEAGKSGVKSYNAVTGKATTIMERPNRNTYTAVVNLNLVAGGKAYYSLDTNEGDEGFYVANPDGSGKKKLNELVADGTYRTARNTLVYNYYGDTIRWRSVNLSNDTVVNLDHGPTGESDRGYADSPGKKFSAFVEERDGRSELYLTNFNGSDERKLTTGAKVGQFVQWYGDDYIVFSVTDDESSLYAVALAGGAPVKITDFYRGNGAIYGGGYNPGY